MEAYIKSACSLQITSLANPLQILTLSDLITYDGTELCISSLASQKHLDLRMCPHFRNPETRKQHPQLSCSSLDRQCQPTTRINPDLLPTNLLPVCPRTLGIIGLACSSSEKALAYGMKLVGSGYQRETTFECKALFTT